MMTMTTAARVDDDCLSNELFGCTVCMSRNQCVVSVFACLARDGEARYRRGNVTMTNYGGTRGIS